MATTQNRQLDIVGTPGQKRPVAMLAQCVSLIILSTGQALATADFARPTGASDPIESASTAFNATFSASDLLYLQTGLGSDYTSDVVLVPLFNYQVCFNQDQADGSLETTITSTWPVLRSTQNSQNYDVPIALQISGNGASSSGSQNILFLKDNSDASKTVRILADSVFSNSQLNTSATFAVTTYSGKKKPFNDTSTGADDKLDHFTNGGVTHTTGVSTPASASSSQFVYNQTTLNNCTAVTAGATATITITGYAYMRELFENPAGTYTLSGSLQFKIHPIGE